MENVESANVKDKEERIEQEAERRRHEEMIQQIDLLVQQGQMTVEEGHQLLSQQMAVPTVHLPPVLPPPMDDPMDTNNNKRGLEPDTDGTNRPNKYQDISQLQGSFEDPEL